MSVTNSTEINCICCSIFKSVIESNPMLTNCGIQFNFVSSMLHMHPDKLDKILEQEISKIHNKKSKTLLLYGDCSPGMIDFQQKNDLERSPGINCIEILLGRQLYRKLRKEGAFFLLPEWTIKWKEIFRFEMGVDEVTSRQIVRECNSKFIYINTKPFEIPIEILDQISEHFGLPYEVINFDPESLYTTLIDLLSSRTNGK